MEQLTFRKATDCDTARILEIIAQAKAQMRSLGSDQWQQGYPAPEDIARDLDSGYGYVLACSGEVIAYGAVVFDGEVAYESLDGGWLSDEPYVVVHRLAVADGQKGRGIATEFMLRTEALARQRGIFAFRIDTNFDNRYMLRLLERLSFTFCGTITYQSGQRQAYQKRL